jgi:hypothetical protein
MAGQNYSECPSSGSRRQPIDVSEKCDTDFEMDVHISEVLIGVNDIMRG